MDNLQDLIVFAEVLETGSFSRAALQLGMAKSSVSKKIAALEQRLGVRLIQRSTRKLRVTDEGQALYLHCQRIKREIAAAEQALAGFRQSPRGKIRVSAPPLFANTRLASLFPEFLRRHPEVSIELHLSESQADLIAGGYDLSLRTGALADSSLVAQRLGTIRTLLCASPAYLEAHGRPRVPAEIERYNYLAWQAPDRLAFREVMFQRGGRNYRAGIVGNFTSTDAMAVKQATVNGGGISLLPDYAVAEELRSGLLEVLLADFDSYSYPLSLVYPQRQQLPLRVRVFSDFLRQALAS